MYYNLQQPRNPKTAIQYEVDKPWWDFTLVDKELNWLFGPNKRVKTLIINQTN